MLSRIADSLFWLSRYMERSDGLLRTIRTHYILMMDKGVNEHLTWQPVLELFTQTDEATLLHYENNPEQALHYFLLDIENINSLKVLLTKARENARGVQDHITKEVWEQVNQLYHSVNTFSSNKINNNEAIIAAIEHLSNNCILYNGVADTTMPRGLGWSFMNVGRYIERCLLTLEMSNQFFALLAYDLQNEKDILFWRPLLLSLSGYELHLKTYRSNTYNNNALHQVLFNENFTRSVLYNVKRIDKYYAEINKLNNNLQTEPLTKLLGRLVSKLKYTDFNSLNQTTLPLFLNETRKELATFSAQLSQQFFSYA
jgi:uncharacterized alpha-E superfamily protein